MTETVTEDHVIGVGFDWYQNDTRKSVKYEQGMKIIYPMIGLCSEVGEVADKIKKTIRDKGGVYTDDGRREIGKEIGDVLWYLARIADELGLSFGDVALTNMKKTADRLARDVVGGSGDNR